jgi:hypothetical protein
MPLPNFLCVGTMKGGTTTLHDLLKQHDEILLPTARKELRFFDVDDNYRKGLQWYEEFFADYRGQRAVGEIAPTYAYREEVPARIAKALGRDVKLIFSLRHPVDRAYSHYVMNCMNESETKDFAKAIALEPQRLQSAFLERLQFGYLDQGRYSVQIRRFLEYFPKENMLFLSFEDDLIDNRREALRKVYAHLAVGDTEIDLDVWSLAAKPVSLQVFPFVHRFSRWNVVKRISKSAPVARLKPFLKKRVPKKLDEATRRQLLKQYYSKEIADLEQLIGRDLKRWYAA